MNDIDSAVDKVIKLIEQWEEEKTRELADRLQLSLTLLKLMVGCSQFNELSAFKRYLDEVDAYILECQKKKYPEDWKKIQQSESKKS